MTWRDLLMDWHDHIDRVADIFPHADPCALVRFRGNRELLAEYIADTHDLTPAEGIEAVELRLLPGAQPVPRLIAAE
ncbi:hypothetical protein CLV78_101371 [Aliiruegeria haliotis]|uniref:Uncharacterized protein n=1 Tax=Aliiruegeria haliotis TaxID=1280846 RepID=A0A2T0RYK5_9RHOB|nr:hypothetical protein [Aliiruegeria haliotis]PRY26276.1 hypothetical protein CLV78_101371 [Aliiruegeria haliotis]